MSTRRRHSAPEATANQVEQSPEVRAPSVARRLLSVVGLASTTTTTGETLLLPSSAPAAKVPSDGPISVSASSPSIQPQPSFDFQQFVYNLQIGDTVALTWRDNVHQTDVNWTGEVYGIGNTFAQPSKEGAWADVMWDTPANVTGKALRLPYKGITVTTAVVPACHCLV